MSTRSNIIVHRQDGQFRRIYCHFDGYLTGVGATLQQHYDSQELADALSELGDISSLDARIAPDKGVEHSFDQKAPGVTVAYGRDRGENNVEGFTAANLTDAWPPEDTWAEYVYVYYTPEGETQPQWFVGDPGDITSLTPLKLALVKDMVVAGGDD